MNTISSIAPSVRTRNAIGHRTFLATLVVAILGLAANHAVAADQDSPAQPVRHGALDDDHLSQVIDFIEARIDTPQRERVEKLVLEANKDLEAFEQQSEAARAPRTQILLADVIDRAALERARIAELKIADQRSRRVNQLLIDVAVLLTPAQRVRLRTDMSK